ncbi:unnamed protein product [Oncorhynchus mykiss]|uniref:Cadherin domain-containing protein n=1 Tax=Oncorhynchus mykiss TaxID=8022 RepID=A0A060WL71_ONCMY|nr:unnamed protein product [Oncorhynchus mykiss]
MGKYLTSLLVLLLQLLCGCTGNQRTEKALALQFTHSVYNATIYENSAAKTYLESHAKMGIYITDPTWEIRYKIVSGDNENLFKAEDYILGDFSFLRIRTKGGSTAILNREVKDHYLLTVKAVERGTNVEARARVQVQVQDTNDLRPLFSPTSYSVSLLENTALRTSVAKVTATDADIGTNGEYYYSFREWTDVFAVHPTSGVVTLTGKLDHAETQLYDLEILAVDRGMKLYGSSGFSSMAKLTVRVEQANEHAPVIAAVTLAPSGADRDPTYAIVTVEDNDQGPNGEIASLSVVAGDPLQQFKALRTSPGSKEYKIKAVKDVDWDTQPFGYNLTLQAKDKGSPPQFSSAKVVHVTSPQFKVGPPKFEHAVYRVNLSEFAPLHTPVAMVTALPKYPQLKYAFRYKTEKTRFAINPDTGLITTTGPIYADYAPKFELEVITSDKKAATKVIIDIIDVNNNAPEFQQTSYKATVDENVPVGSNVLAVKATDLDSGENGYVTYSIANVSPQPFVIDYFSGVIGTSEELDYELMPRIYNLKIRASDWGSPFRREVEASVTVTLNNLNDNKPLFENVDCEVTVPRDHGVGEQITTVSAIDADELQLVRYDIKTGNDLDLFELNSNSGVLSLKRTLSEGEAGKVSFHSLQIRASDGEHETEPMIMNITVITARKPVQLKCVDTGVATMLAEKLLHGTKIHTPTEPDDNLMDIHTVNRYSPQFAESFPSVIEVKEDLPVGARVVHLSASDTDSGFNGKLVYVISGGDAESRFIVDMNTGWLLVHTPLDRETTDHYTLNVTVYDLGIPQKSSSRLLDVKILDANDNSPQFLQDSYSVEISEKTPVGTEIVQVDSTDKDQGDNGVIRYSIVADTDQFAIDELTGVVTVKKQLDREVHPVYILKIAACDQAVNDPQLVSTVLLKVVLEDVNDNPPKFIPSNYRVKVREDLPVGTVIMWLEAHDPDVGLSSQVRYSLSDNGDGNFEVDKLSGAVRILQTLDYEKKQVYNLTAKAKDKGKPVSLSSTCFIEVDVVDVNENLYRPWFPSFVDKGFIKEDALIGTSVMKVTAQDEDKGRDREIRYSIRDGSGLGIFTIDEETGLVTTTSRKLDREQQDEHILEITVTDHGVPAKSTTVRVIVKVLDENDNRPQFLEKIYKIKLPEREKPEKDRALKRDPVYRVIASDRDEGANSEISYSIEEGDEHGKFFIEPKTGLVSSKKFSSAGEYDILTIKAVDNGRPQKSSTCRLHIEWIPKPEVAASARPLAFEEPPFFFSVMESDPVAHMVGVITTETSDTPVWFEITGGNYDSRFDVGKASGTLIVARPLDAEQKSNYNLTVEATDGTRFVSTRVLIRVIDTNNHRPQFSQPRYEVVVAEDTPPETEVLRIGATDEDDKNKLTFTLLSSTDPFSLKKFRLDPGTGALYTAERLDHETMRRHTLTVMVRDQDIPVKRNLVRVIVDVEDTNDNAPWFAGSPYSGRVFESAALGSAVLQVAALDKDKGQNAEIIYSIESGNVANSFAIDPVLGTVTVAKELDRSSKNQFELAVKATDKGTPSLTATATVHIAVTMSDNASPRFTEKEFTAEVSELVLPGSFVTMISATSQSSVFYQIKGGNTDGTFDVNPNSGVVVTSRALDYEMTPEYRLTIQGTNMAGLASNTTLLIHLKDENDNAPIFLQPEFTGMISESAPINSVVLTRENTPLVIRASDTDRDANAMLVYQIVEPFAHNYFAIDSSTGAIRMTTTLDFEQRSVFCFTIQVHDLGMPRLFAETAANVTVEVIDVNDCSPQFSQELYETSVIVPTYKGVEVIKKKTLAIIASVGNHVNEPLFYTILNPDKRFQISRTSGVLSTTGIPFDREAQDMFNIVVEVTRKDASSEVAHVLVMVTVEDVNDNQPMFVNLPYQALVQVDAEEGQAIHQLHTPVVHVQATDSEGPKIVYTISEGDAFSQFSINFNTGVIHVIQPLDFETHPAYKLSVRATDSLTGAHADVFVDIILEDVNDNPPVFQLKSYNASVSEASFIGTAVLQVAATDPDTGNNKVLFYQLVEDMEKSSDYFSVDRDSGIIWTARMLDQEEKQQHKLTVRAVDGGVPALSSDVTVTVDVTDLNDNAPTFTESSYKATVSELAPRGHFVTHVQASDADSSDAGRLEFSILSGNKDQNFAMDKNTGAIVISNHRKPQMEPLYNLNVSVSDGVFRNSAMVKVTVNGANFHNPTFPQLDYVVELTENSPVGTLVAEAKATDEDAGTYGRLTYHIVNNFAKDKFSVNENGEIFTLDILDRENAIEKVIPISLMAKDGGGKVGFCIINVILTDINDNAPQFRAVEYKANVASDVPRGTTVVKIAASDMDEGSNADIAYTMEADMENVEENFEIHPFSGVILEKRMDHETTKWYQLTLQAQSQQEGYETVASVDVNIQVKDLNDNKPVFESDPYEAVVVENLPDGTPVIQVKATDQDSGTNGQVIYSLDPKQTSAEISVLFAVNSETGWVTTLKELDREKTSKYTIAVLATDRGDKVQLVTSTTVEVTVADVNDNPPRFTAEIYKGTVSEDDLPPSGVIAILSTTDADTEDINKQVNYFITGGDPLGQFAIEHLQNEWKVSVRKPLDREERDNYLLNITATDGTFAAKAVVEVKVLDANDNSPVCEKSLYTERVPEDIPAGRLILQVSATDADIRSNAHITYELQGPGAELFTIDPDTEPTFHLTYNRHGSRLRFSSLLCRKRRPNDLSPTLDNALPLTPTLRKVTLHWFTSEGREKGFEETRTAAVWSFTTKQQSLYYTYFPQITQTHKESENKSNVDKLPYLLGEIPPCRQSSKSCDRQRASGEEQAPFVNTTHIYVYLFSMLYFNYLHIPTLYIDKGLYSFGTVMFTVNYIKNTNKYDLLFISLLLYYQFHLLWQC